VSEERGQVSVAERGKLTRMAAPADLKNRLVRFHERHFPKQENTFWTRLVRENARLKVASLLVACLAWVLMVYEAETIQQTFNVPIEYRNRPEDLVLDDATPVQARITLRGYQRAFNLLDPAELKFSIDLSRFDEGEHRVELDETRIGRTGTLEIDRISPPTIPVILHRPRDIELAVELTTTGRVPPPAELVSITPNPSRIKAILLNSNARDLHRVYTEPIPLGQFNKSTTTKAKLMLPEDVRLPKGAPSSVDVRVEIRQPSSAEANNAGPAVEK
jgi:YbbR domain-containing protein